jgi:release factor glutamine methyltransferase
MTLRELAAAIRRRLESAGIDDAALEAEGLVRTATGASREAYFAGAEAPPSCHVALDRLVARRLAREPLAYISGEREFYGLAFGVNSAVLIPRPESELLVERTLNHLHGTPDALVVDVGTGSGCLAVAIEAHRNTKGRTLGVDVSAAAVAVARLNARRHNARVAFVRGSLADAVGTADIVVANLPYIPSDEVDALEPELRDWEPRIALDGGTDGLQLIRELIDDCAQRLQPSRLLLEVAMGQADPVSEYARLRSCSVTVYKDLAGIDRVVDVRWRSGS